jgi:hypothetical protein
MVLWHHAIMYLREGTKDNYNVQFSALQDKRCPRTCSVLQRREEEFGLMVGRDVTSTIRKNQERVQVQQIFYVMMGKLCHSFELKKGGGLSIIALTIPCQPIKAKLLPALYLSHPFSSVCLPLRPLRFFRPFIFIQKFPDDVPPSHKVLYINT